MNNKDKSKVKFYSFDEFIDYGLKHSDNIVDGMPWSFEFEGYAVTHENNQCYLVPTEVGMKEFTPNHTLMLDVNGHIYPHELPCCGKQNTLNRDKVMEILQKRTHDSYTGGDEKLHEIRSTHRRVILFDIATEICSLTVAEPVSERPIIEQIVIKVLDGMIGIGGIPGNDEFCDEFDMRLRAALDVSQPTVSEQPDVSEEEIRKLLDDWDIQP